MSPFLCVFFFLGVCVYFGGGAESTHFLNCMVTFRKKVKHVFTKVDANFS